MSTKPKDPLPKTAQGEPSKSQGERAADDQIRASDQGYNAPKPVTENSQKPPAEVKDSPDHGSEKEERSEARELWIKFKQDPFAVALSLSTAGVMVASFILAGATIGVWLATNRPGDATIDLSKATNLLAKYAEEQGRDMRESLVVARDTVATATNLTKATQEAVKVAEGHLGVVKEQLEIQRLAGRDTLNQQRPRTAIVVFEVRNFDIPPGLFESMKPIDGRIQIRNIGPTTASKIGGWAHIVVAPFTVTSFRKNGPDIDFTSDTLGATLDLIGSVMPDRAITKDEAERVITGRSAIFAYGEIKYTDALKSRTYITKFRYWYKGDGYIPSDHILKLVPTKEGNERD